MHTPLSDIREKHTLSLHKHALFTDAGATTSGGVAGSFQWRCYTFGGLLHHSAVSQLLRSERGKVSSNALNATSCWQGGLRGCHRFISCC